jgi:hypothetical protein
MHRWRIIRAGMVNAPLPNDGGDAFNAKGYQRLTKPRAPEYFAKLASMLHKLALAKI